METLIKYRDGYRYQLAETIAVSIPIFPGIPIETEYIFLDKNGHLVINKGYCWDGASGPTWDDKTNMRASLIHDVFYQLMRMGMLNQVYREVVDHIMYTILIEDGMAKFRAKYYYWAVRKFAGKHADPKYKKKVYEAP